ncbi:MAG: response regulator [Sinobacteraceae bacterium]|nr:response regulator [Nevskiaceae bacterium]
MSKVLLVVDDNPTNLRLMVKTLQLAGYGVLTAPDAEKAAAVLREASVDLILMDVGLPGMDGLTLTQRLKSDRCTQHIPIVIVTSFAMKSDEEAAWASGCDGFITKPINTRTLAQQLLVYLS